MAGEPSAVVSARELRCEACGAPWTLRGFSTTRTAACEHCGAVFDTSGEAWKLVYRVEGAFQVKPVYALGTRGTLGGVEWEVIGWVSRSVRAYGARYVWEEHLLYNPYEGFRYLIYQDGHFVLVAPIAGVPTAGLQQAAYAGRTYRHFSSAEAVVDEVLGEFPWEVRSGERVTASDYIDPPRILSSEEAEGEVVWSEGRYMPRAEVVAAFGQPTRALGYAGEPHPCEPNPARGLARWMSGALAVGLLLWLLATCIYLLTRNDQVVFQGTASEQLDADVTLAPGDRPIELEARADVDNSWVYYDVMLVDKRTDQASYLGLEVSYYHGTSGGESWSEGSRSESMVVSGLPGGEYLLQMTRHPESLYKGPVQVALRRDVPLYRYPICALLPLLLVPLLAIARARAFEQRRWQQSDHAG